VRDSGAEPATIAVLDGRLHVGLDADELARLARLGPDAAKCSRRDLALVLQAGGSGGTTVAATMIAARLAGIRVFATGGIGGVHRGATQSFDVSADLTELACTPVAVVCAGPKAILDIAATLEVLETHGVPVIGYQADRLPAFWSRDSGYAVDQRLDTPAEIAAALELHWSLGLHSGAVIANPLPPGQALPGEMVEKWIDAALVEAETAGVRGKALTPFLLERVESLSGGASLDANAALVVANARLGARIALALAGCQQPSTGL
jgi:pseudouridine-5'-phosphate glycosidase